MKLETQLVVAVFFFWLSTLNTIRAVVDLDRIDRQTDSANETNFDKTVESIQKVRRIDLATFTSGQIDSTNAPHRFDDIFQSIRSLIPLNRSAIVPRLYEPPTQTMRLTMQTRQSNRIDSTACTSRHSVDKPAHQSHNRSHRSHHLHERFGQLVNRDAT
jgi:hypothetical protein